MTHDRIAVLALASRRTWSEEASGLLAQAAMDRVLSPPPGRR